MVLLETVPASSLLSLSVPLSTLFSFGKFGSNSRTVCEHACKTAKRKKRESYNLASSKQSRESLGLSEAILCQLHQLHEVSVWERRAGDIL